MNKLILGAMCLSAISFAFAQATPVPEATTQETCAIEEKDVDTMMDEYIASKGWHEGENEKNGRKFFVAKGTGVIQAPRASQQYIDSRVNAYNKAMLEAKKAMVEYLNAEIATATKKEYAEGSAVVPADAKEGPDKLKSFLYEKLNKDLAAEGIDPAKDPAAAAAAIGKQLNSESYKKMISSMAQAKVLGFQSACTFEGTPASGKGEIGVVAIWSEKLEQMAFSMSTGAKVPTVGAKKPISEQVSSDPRVLMSTFGVQQMIDEHGDLVLVSFGQAGAISESKLSANAAKTKAKQNAMAALREFAGEQVAVATDTLNAETTEEFESGAEAYSNESAMKDKIAAVAAKMKIVGAAPLRNVKAKHPVNGKTVFVCVLTWSPKQAAQVTRLRNGMSRPPRPGTNVQPSVPHNRGFDNMGHGADDDAY